MTTALFQVPTPQNEPIRQYVAGSAERARLVAEIARQKGEMVEYGPIIGGKMHLTGERAAMVMPHEHGHRLGFAHAPRASDTVAAIEAALDARQGWANLPFHARAAVVLKAAELFATRYRETINAATMLNIGKNVMQAEIDAACELVDFFRFNVAFAEQIAREQPKSSAGVWNRVEYRGLEGFVLAVTPFNFTAIAANLPVAPMLMGCTVVWKPSPNALLAPYYIMRVLEEAGMPKGVINLLPGGGADVGEVCVNHRELAGVHFTGSTKTFQWFWQKVGGQIERYRGYPRLVGETGGKDFVFAHGTADVELLTAQLVRGAYEYAGQKCSAASRAYIAKSIWPEVRERLVAAMGEIRMGDVTGDLSLFMGAVIDGRAFARLSGVLEFAKRAPGYRVLAGGSANDEVGYFVAPTLIEVEDPKARVMEEEFFGPILAVFVYDDDKYEEALRLCGETSPYALTGAFFGRDRAVIEHAATVLREAAGNFYINDKCTGAVVGQQPFGGARASGTNDKAGAAQNLMRWVSTRTVKETLDGPRDFRYPHNAG